MSIRDKKRYNLRPRPEISKEPEENSPRKLTSKEPVSTHKIRKGRKKTEQSINKCFNSAIEELVKNVTEDVTEDVVERVVQLVLKEANMDNVNEQLDDDDDDDDDDDYKINLGFCFDKEQTILDNDEWKKELNEAQIIEYGFIFQKLKDRKLTLSKILDSKLTTKEKEQVIYKFIHPLGDPNEEVIQFIEHREKQKTDLVKIKKHEELEEKLNKYITNKLTLKQKILDLKLHPKYKSIIWEKYQALQNMDPGQGEYHKLSDWINWVVKMPWGIYHQYITPIDSTKPDYNIKLKETVIRVLDNFNTVYGLQFAKEEVLLHVVQKLLITQEYSDKELPSQGKTGGQILAIEGPPGVGKTYLLKQLANSLKIPLESIPLGGCKDASYLDGHSFTYEGSMPGRFAQALKNMKCSNGIIYLDEIDKLSDSQQGQEVSSLMLHALDETQNYEFYDKYFSDIPIDLSKILFVLSINDREKIDPVLRQRLNIIKIDAPTIEDKVEIAKRCMLPIMFKELKLSNEDVIINDDCIRYIVKHISTQEEGVRSLKQNLFSLCKRLFFLKHTKFTKDDKHISFVIDDIQFPVNVTRDMIDILLKDHRQEVSESLLRMYN